MAIWEVDVRAQGVLRLVLEADTVESAMKRAYALANKAAESPSFFDLENHTLCAEAARVVGDGARLSTYRCSFCGLDAIKEDWGPGRVRCPACRKVAPSASEVSS